MQHRYYVLGCGLIATLITIAFAGKIDSSGPTLTEQTLEAIENCIAQSAISWPDEWKKKYIDTIRSEIELHREATHFALRLDILRRGFAPCWEDLTKNKDRALFEVYHCRMRWYVEHLMGKRADSFLKLPALEMIGIPKGDHDVRTSDYE